jgi:hypothetical protein
MDPFLYDRDEPWAPYVGALLEFLTIAAVCGLFAWLS